MQECGQNGGMAKKSKFRTALEWFGLSKAFTGLISSGAAAVTTGGSLYVFWQSLIVLPLLIQFFLSFGVFLFFLAFFGRGWQYLFEPQNPPSLNLTGRLEIPKKADKAETTVNINLTDAVPREEHEALKERVKGIEADIESLMSSEQKAAVVRKLSEDSPAGAVIVASDTSVIGKTHAVEIRSTLEEAGWPTTSGIQTGEIPEGITVSGLASGLVSAAFEQADLYIKEDPTDKTGPTYIMVGLREYKKKNKQ